MHNEKAANDLLGAVENVIMERLPITEAFEPYHSVKERNSRQVCVCAASTNLKSIHGFPYMDLHNKSSAEMRVIMTIGNVSGYSPYDPMYTGPLNRGGQNQAAGPVQGADGEQKSANPDEVKKTGRRSSPQDCETCKNRKYQDGSDESNVSFKSASHISPESAASKVRAHENEHVSNAYKKAATDNGKVLNASVSIQTAVCPECGRTYVSGGVTNTTIKYTNEENPYTKNQKALDTLNYRGANIDYAA